MNSRDDRPSSEAVLSLFSEISAVPRCSKKEKRIRDWVESWAEQHSLAHESDSVGNIVVRVPGARCAALAETVVLQAHLDMVCEKSPDSTHDFDRDPIEPRVDGEWLRADGTTLGADNGIAVAMALAVVESGHAHPPLELLFTVDEESGLTGALELSDRLLTGRLLLNLDSEDEGRFTVGCAGGRDTDITIPTARERIPDGHSLIRIDVSRASGGHSGMEIAEQRANANVVLGRALALVDAVGGRVAMLHGGNAHNAIPRDARAVCSVPTDRHADVVEMLSELAQAVGSEHKNTDPSIAIVSTPVESVAEISPDAAVLTEKDSRSVVRVVRAMPHGVVRMMSEIPGLVETSTNFATIRTKPEAITILTSQRSARASALDASSDVVVAIAELAGATAKKAAGYPSWEPDFASPLISVCTETWSRMFANEPVVEVVHAGLECGVIGSKYPGMRMISFGPTIVNPHSPDEALHLPSLATTWIFLLELLAVLAKG